MFPMDGLPTHHEAHVWTYELRSYGGEKKESQEDPYLSNYLILDIFRLTLAWIDPYLCVPDLGQVRVRFH